MRKTFTFSKILMLIGAAWIICFSVLASTKVIDFKLFGQQQASALGLIFVGILYILVPFSVKSGTWSRIWAILITLLSLLLVAGFFVGPDVDYKQIFTYVNALPYVLMALGAILWVIQG